METVLALEIMLVYCAIPVKMISTVIHVMVLASLVLMVHVTMAEVETEVVYVMPVLMDLLVKIAHLAFGDLTALPVHLVVVKEGVVKERLEMVPAFAIQDLQEVIVQLLSQLPQLLKQLLDLQLL